MRMPSVLSLLVALAAVAAEPLPRVTILATGGTIAGAGTSSTATVGYKSGAIGVEHLLAAVPELAKVATVRGE